jgi:hypothetical protein
VCRQRGLDEVHVMSAGQVSRSRLGAFDTLLLLGGNMALLGQRDQAKRKLARLHRIATPGAHLLGANRDWSKSQDSETREKAARNVANGRFSGEHRTRIRYRKFVTPFFTSSRTSPDELQDLVRGTGWALGDVLDRGEGIYVAVLQRL